MSALSLHKVIEQIRRLPSLPAVVAELLREFDSDGAGTNDLARKIGQDQALSAAVLRLANSSFYGMSGRISNVQRAAVVLGTQSLRTLAIAAGIVGQYAAIRCHGFDWRRFWQHAFAAAVCARALARHCKQDPDTAFTAALVHDIGRLALVTLYPQEYEKVLAHSTELQVSLLDSERLLLGLDHALVGATLAQRWKLPATIQQAIANHHQPEVQPLCPITDVVHAADRLTQEPGGTNEQIIAELLAAAPGIRLNLDAQQLKSCADDAVAGAREFGALLLEEYA